MADIHSKPKTGAEHGTEMQPITIAGDKNKLDDSARRFAFGPPRRPEYSAEDEKLRETEPLKWAQRVVSNPESYTKFRYEHWSNDKHENGHEEQDALLRGVPQADFRYKTVADELQSRFRRIPGYEGIKVSLIEAPPHSVVDKCGHDAFLKLELNGQPPRLVPFDLTSRTKGYKANVVTHGDGWLRQEKQPGNRESTLSLTDKGLSAMADRLQEIMAERCGGKLPTDPSVLMNKAGIEEPRDFHKMLHETNLTQMPDLAAKYAEHLNKNGYPDEAKRIKDGFRDKNGDLVRNAKGEVVHGSALDDLQGRKDAWGHAISLDIKEAMKAVSDDKKAAEKTKEAAREQRRKDLAEKEAEQRKKNILDDTHVSIKDVSDRLRSNVKFQNELIRLNAGDLDVYKKYAKQIADERKMAQTQADTCLSLDDVMAQAKEKIRQCKKLPDKDPQARQAGRDLHNLEDPSTRAETYDRLARAYQKERSSNAPAVAPDGAGTRPESRGRQSAGQADTAPPAGNEDSLDFPDLPELTGHVRPRLDALQPAATKPGAPAPKQELAAAPTEVLVIPPVDKKPSEAEPEREGRAGSEPGSAAPEGARSGEHPAPGHESTRPAPVHESTHPAPGHESTHPAPGHESTHPTEKARNGRGVTPGIGSVAGAILLYYMAKDGLAALGRRLGSGETAKEN